jgi:hypothetical protein
MPIISAFMPWCQEVEYKQQGLCPKYYEPWCNSWQYLHQIWADLLHFWSTADRGSIVGWAWFWHGVWWVWLCPASLLCWQVYRVLKWYSSFSFTEIHLSRHPFNVSSSVIELTTWAVTVPPVLLQVVLQFASSLAIASLQTHNSPVTCCKAPQAGSTPLMQFQTTLESDDHNNTALSWTWLGRFVSRSLQWWVSHSSPFTHIPSPTSLISGSDFPFCCLPLASAVWEKLAISLQSWVRS